MPFWLVNPQLALAERTTCLKTTRIEEDKTLLAHSDANQPG